MKIYRFFLPGLMLIPVLSQGQAPEDDPLIPVAYPAGRYDQLAQRSPFTLSSAAPERNPGFAENLALSGVVKIGQESLVSLMDKTTQKRLLVSEKPNAQGLRLVKLESSPELEKVRVTLQKGQETAVLRYDLNYLKTAVAAKSAEAKPTPAAVSSDAAAPTPPPATRPVRRKFIPAQPGQSPSNTESPSP